MLLNPRIFVPKFLSIITSITTIEITNDQNSNIFLQKSYHLKKNSMLEKNY